MTKAYKGIGMEGAIAKWYTSQTKKSLDEFSALARRVAEQVPPGGNVLEVAPGPGYFAIELAKLGGRRVTGLDISETFVEIARAKATKENVEADFRHGNASGMPFKSEIFDFLVCRAAFKNFADPVGALREMYRVLKPGGKALIIDLRKDVSKKSIGQSVEAMKLSAVNSAIVKLTFRFMLIKRAYTKADFERMLGQTKFEKIEIQEDPIGLEVRLEKTQIAGHR